MTLHRHDPETDPFRPPAIPTEVCCLHCQQEYESYLMEWREVVGHDGKRAGFWCCPTPGCSGRGFGFDIFPLDPEYRDEDGEPMGPFAGEGEQGDALDDFDDLDEMQADDGAWQPADESSSLWDGEPIDADALFDDDADEGAPRSESGPPPIDLDDESPWRRRRDGNDGDIPY